jgi:hypothetical protein
MPRLPAAPPLDLATLRALWKPRRDSYAHAHLYEENRIRIHRAFTWLEHAESCREGELDDRFLAQWSGLAALFARWDAAKGHPVPQKAALAAFIRQLVATDHDGLLAGALVRDRALVSGVFTDRYLQRFFPDAVDVRGLYERRRWEKLLSLVLERVAFVHAQVAGGGATHGSRENRTVLKRASMALDRVALAAIQVVIDHGYAEDWGDLCWPPARR